MIEIFPFAGYPVALYGLDESGLFTARALQAGEAELSAWDNSSDNRFSAEKAGIEPVDFTKKDLREFTTLVVSSQAWDTDRYARIITEDALDNNLEVICDVELLARTQREASFVGITGDYGKSLTGALVTYIMQVTGREAEMVGFSGSSALNTEPLGMEGAYIIEMTPFRLNHTVSITYDVATLLNLCSEEQVDNTMQIFHRQTSPRAAVISVDDKPSHIIFNKLSKGGEQRVFPFSMTKPIKGGAFVSSGILYDSFDKEEPVAVIDLASIPQFAGPYAQASVLGAFATVRAVGVEPHQAMAAINSFPGLVGHLETVEKIEGVEFINDSASNSLNRISSSFLGYRNIHWVGGGNSKCHLENISILDAVIDKIDRVYLFGSVGKELEKAIGKRIPVKAFKNLEKACLAAHNQVLSIEPPSVVIYAPSCYSNDKGDAFRSFIETLPGERNDEE